MKLQTVTGAWVCVGLCSATVALAHSEQAIRDAFSQGPIPEEVAEATREFNSSAGMNAFRASAHTKQHQLLEEYLKAGWRRTCADSQSLLPSLDEAIRVARDTGNAEEESNLRSKRDTVAAIIVDTCTETNGPPSQP